MPFQIFYSVKRSCRSIAAAPPVASSSHRVCATVGQIGYTAGVSLFAEVPDVEVSVSVSERSKR